MENLVEISFKQHYRGAFTNMLRWHQLDQLWENVKAKPDGWYVYFIGKGVPLNPVSAEACYQFIDEIDQLLRREHDYDYCGIVYADNPQNPTLIKIFDPNHLGASCGSSGEVIPPGWILSRIPPEPIEHTLLIPENRKRWWQRLFPK